MEIKFHGMQPRTMRLIELVRARIADYNVGTAFIYEGHIYSLIVNRESSPLKGEDMKFVPCLNLKSATCRDINSNHTVQPVRVEIHVDAERTHRFPDAS